MNELRLRMETVTPLFLGGADPRGRPELRPHSIRGAMRFWLRALLGGIYGDDDNDLAKVEEQEKIIFGSAGEKADTASSIMVRKFEDNLKEITFSDIVEKYDYQNKQGQKKEGFHKPGIVYLFFAARKTRNDPERNALEGSFTLDFSLRPGVSANAGIIEQIYCSLWLLTRFGGLGSRARRGAGNLRVIELLNCPEYLTELPLIIAATTPKQLANELGHGLRAIQTLTGKPQTLKHIHVPARFDIFHPGVCSIWVIDKSYDNWKIALDELGSFYSGFRKRRAPDYDTIKTSMTRDVDLKQPVQRAAFGLPIPFLFNSLKGVVKDNQSILQSRVHDRRASPLIFRIIRMANGRCAIVVLWFNSEFLPKGEHSRIEQLKLIHGREEHFGNTPGMDLIEEFLLKNDSVNRSSLSDKGLALIEVNYD